MKTSLLPVLLLLTTLCPAKTHRKPELRVFLPSRQSLLKQNAEINRLGLSRVKDDKELLALEASRDLVQIPQTKALRIASNIPQNRRYCRPWTLTFLQDLSYDYWMHFGVPIQLNSAVRTVRTQRGLLRWNRNAAPTHGDLASSHLAGLTVDIARRGLTQEQKRWIQIYLLSLGDSVIVEEELRYGGCFHICIKENYESRR